MALGRAGLGAPSARARNPRCYPAESARTPRSALPASKPYGWFGVQALGPFTQEGARSPLRLRCYTRVVNSAGGSCFWKRMRANGKCDDRTQGHLDDASLGRVLRRHVGDGMRGATGVHSYTMVLARFVVGTVLVALFFVFGLEKMR